MEDPIPSKVMRPALDATLLILTRLVNTLLQEGSMEGIKESVLDPLLKKAGFDVDNN